MPWALCSPAHSPTPQAQRMPGEHGAIKQHGGHTDFPKPRISSSKCCQALAVGVMTQVFSTIE